MNKQLVSAFACSVLASSCGLIKFNINGAGATIQAESNNTLGGGCGNDELFNLSITQEEMVKPLRANNKDFDINNACFDSVKATAYFELQGVEGNLSTSTKVGDSCVTAHPDAFGKYGVNGVVVSYDYVEGGTTKTEEFTVKCANNQIDFATGDAILIPINKCLDEVEAEWNDEILVALNRHATVFRVGAVQEDLELCKGACFHIKYVFKFKVEQSSAHPCK